MINNANTFNHNHEGHILLTYELFYLLQWLMDHESEALKKIIVRALKNGFNKDMIKSNELVEMQITDPVIQECVTEFLGLMDALLIEATAEQSVKKTLERSAIPALDHIDLTICNDETVKDSLKKATTQLSDNPEQSAQELLLKELLRRWKPEKKHIIN